MKFACYDNYSLSVQNICVCVPKHQINQSISNTVTPVDQIVWNVCVFWNAVELFMISCLCLFLGIIKQLFGLNKNSAVEVNLIRSFPSWFTQEPHVTARTASITLIWLKHSHYKLLFYLPCNCQVLSSFVLRWTNLILDKFRRLWIN